jgi:hypothetical protein
LRACARAGAFGAPLAAGAPFAALPGFGGGGGGGFAPPPPVLFAAPPPPAPRAPPHAAGAAPPPPSGLVPPHAVVSSPPGWRSAATRRWDGAPLHEAPAAAAPLPAAAAPPPGAAGAGAGAPPAAAAPPPAAAAPPPAAAAAAPPAADESDDEVVFVPPPPPVVIDLLDDDDAAAAPAEAPAAAPAAAAPAAAAAGGAGGAGGAVADSQEDPSVCVVCFEQFTSGGAHRPASLRCGHVFGRSCIATWLESANRAQHACPVCKRAAAADDIRPLYVAASGLQALDTRELEAAQRETAAARAALDAARAAAAALVAQLAAAQAQVTQQATQLQSFQLQATQAAQVQALQQPRSAAAPAVAAAVAFPAAPPAAAAAPPAAAAVPPPLHAASRGDCWGEYRCAEVVPIEGGGGVCCDIQERLILLGCAPPAAPGAPPPLPCVWRLDASHPSLVVRVSLRPGGGPLRDVRLAPPAWHFRCAAAARTHGDVGDPLALALCARRLSLLACGVMLELGAVVLPVEGCSCAWGPPDSDEGACDALLFPFRLLRSHQLSQAALRVSARGTRTRACTPHPSARLRRRGGGRAGERSGARGANVRVFRVRWLAASGRRRRGRVHALRARSAPQPLRILLVRPPASALRAAVTHARAARMQPARQRRLRDYTSHLSAACLGRRVGREHQSPFARYGPDIPKTPPTSPSCVCLCASTHIRLTHASRMMPSCLPLQCMLAWPMATSSCTPCLPSSPPSRPWWRSLRCTRGAPATAFSYSQTRPQSAAIC